MKTLKELSPEETNIILESISDGVFTVDRLWHITFFNRSAEKITGIRREQALGMFCWDVFRSNMCQEGCALKKTMKRGTDNLNSSTRIVNQQGRSIPISVSTSLLKDEAGKVLGGVETFRDISLVEELRSEIQATMKLGGMASCSREMQKIFSIVPLVAESDSAVLIEGETGTGKELISRAIHSHSHRKMNKFLAINCGALPDTLLESELFGYKAGAFTGANRDKPGLFEIGGEGTILLDEIGEISHPFQVKLLRLLEEREFLPLGGVKTIKSRARILAATNRNLAEMVEGEYFRRDLFYRINVIHLKLPPLRKRKEDIPLLIESFIRKMNIAKGREVTGIAPEALAMLTQHDYPGNIRELENIIEHAFVLCRGKLIHSDHLPGYLIQAAGAEKSRPATEDSHSLRSTVESIERKLILETLKNCRYNRSETAQRLSMNKSTLYRKIHRLAIDLPEFDGRSKLPPKK